MYSVQPLYSHNNLTCFGFFLVPEALLCCRVVVGAKETILCMPSSVQYTVQYVRFAWSVRKEDDLLPLKKEQKHGMIYSFLNIRDETQLKVNQEVITEEEVITVLNRKQPASITLNDFLLMYLSMTFSI